MLAHCEVIADEAIVGSLGVCCRHQDRCDDQAEHVASGRVREFYLSNLTPYHQAGHQNGTRNFVKFPLGGTNFSVLKNDQTGTGTHEASRSVGAM